MKLSKLEPMKASSGVRGHSRLNKSSLRSSPILRRRQWICSASRRCNSASFFSSYVIVKSSGNLVR